MRAIDWSKPPQDLDPASAEIWRALVPRIDQNTPLQPGDGLGLRMVCTVVVFYLVTKRTWQACPCAVHETEMNEARALVVDWLKEYFLGSWDLDGFLAELEENNA